MTDSTTQKLIAIVGPTASGKSALAVELCLRIGGEVISCDSMMVYRGMDIGTAKVTQAEMRGVPHYMLDVTDASHDYSAAEYREAVRPIIGDIAQRGKWPVMCGGTGLYLDAATREMSFSNAPADAAVRAELERELSENGARISAPPARSCDDYVVVVIDIAQVFLELRPCVIALLLPGYLCTLHIVCRIFLDRLYLKEVGSHCSLYVLGDKLSVALFEIFEFSGNIVLSLA